PEGATIVAQDDTGRTLYVILQGRVKVVHHGEAGSAAAPLAEFGDGEFFGEMALLENAPRSADVIATAPTTCALLSWELFLQDLPPRRWPSTAPASSSGRWRCWRTRPAPPTCWR